MALEGDDDDDDNLSTTC